MTKKEWAQRIIILICVLIFIYAGYYIVSANLDARLAGMGF